MNGPDDHLHQLLRSIAVRAVVKSLNDAGGDQLADVAHAFGRERSGVPVLHPFGFSSSVPMDGAIAVLLSLGADPADLVALHAYNPSVARFGSLETGESVVYDAVGQRLHFRGGKLCDVQAQGEFRVSIGGSQVFDLTAKQATISVPLVAEKGITVVADGIDVQSGDVKAGTVSLIGHEHGEVQFGDDTSGPPVQ